MKIRRKFEEWKVTELPKQGMRIIQRTGEVSWVVVVVTGSSGLTPMPGCG